MKIKLKVKTLVIGALAIFVAFYFAIPNVTLGIATYYDNKDIEKAQLFYEKYASIKGTVSARLDYAQSLIGSFSRYTIFVQGWGGSGSMNPAKKETATDILKKNLEKEPSKHNMHYYVKSYEMLMDISIASGDVKELKGLINWGKLNSYEEVVYASNVYDAFLKTVNRDNGAKAIINDLQSINPEDSRLKVLEAENALFEGNLEKAKRLYGDLKITGYPYFGSNTYSYRNYWLTEPDSALGSDGFVEGRILFEGEPMPFIEVYLTEGGGGFRVEGGSYIGITDENGYFKSVGLKEGLYDVGIGVYEGRLYDKVLSKNFNGYTEITSGSAEVQFQFRNPMTVVSPGFGEIIEGEDIVVSWLEVAGASYYTVEPVIFLDPFDKASGSGRSPIKTESGQVRIKGNFARFKLSDLQFGFGGLSWDGEESIIAPGAITGSFIAGIEYPITVNAYDEDNSLISSSLPLKTYYNSIPSIIISGEMSKGQKLVASRKYPEAIAWYEEISEREPENFEANSTLAKIYGIGWKDGEKQLEKALIYLDRIESPALKANILSVIVEFMSVDEMSKHKEVVNETIDMMTEMDNNDVGFLKYKLYSKEKDWEKALESLNEIQDYVPEQLVLLNLYFGKYEDALAALRDKDYYPSRLQGGIFTGAIKGLINKPPDENDMKVFREFIEDVKEDHSYSNRIEIYKHSVNNLENENLRIIIDEIYNNWNWDILY